MTYLSQLPNRDATLTGEWLDSLDDLIGAHGETQARFVLARLLDRAAEIGLLTAHGGGYYAIHPAVPWFFRRLDAVEEDPDAGRSLRPLIAR